MPHELEALYGLTAEEILDGISRRFRARVAVEGVIAEMQLDRKLRQLVAVGTIASYEAHDLDGMHDFTLALPGRSDKVRVEVKNVRNKDEGYYVKRVLVAYKKVGLLCS